MSIVIHQSPVAQWHSLICDAEAVASYFLDEDLQSYVVFLLMRFVNNPGISDKVLALDYINSLRSRGTLQHDQMRDVGDTCLLYAGLFPARAARKRVSSNYFTHLGRGAYQVLSDNPEHMQHHVYQRLSAAFTPITRILQSIDKLKSRKPVELEQASSKLITSIDTFTSH